MKKILLVEDDKSIAFIVGSALESEHFNVTTCCNANEAISALKTNEYDLLILDWNLPDEITGLEICQTYRNGGGNKPVMLLTGRASTVDKVKGLEAGADDYIVKPFEIEEFLARSKALLRRLPNLDTEILKVGDLELNVRTFRAYKNTMPIELLPKEIAILELLMRNPNCYFEAETILARVWRTDSSASTDSVRTFIKTLRKKIGDIDSKSSIVNKRGLGYSLAIE